MNRLKNDNIFVKITYDIYSIKINNVNIFGNVVGIDNVLLRVQPELLAGQNIPLAYFDTGFSQYKIEESLDRVIYSWREYQVSEINKDTFDKVPINLKMNIDTYGKNYWRPQWKRW